MIVIIWIVPIFLDCFNRWYVNSMRENQIKALLIVFFDLKRIVYKELEDQKDKRKTED